MISYINRELFPEPFVVELKDLARCEHIDYSGIHKMWNGILLAIA